MNTYKVSVFDRNTNDPTTITLRAKDEPHAARLAIDAGWIADATGGGAALAAGEVLQHEDPVAGGFLGDCAAKLACAAVLFPPFGMVGVVVAALAQEKSGGRHGGAPFLANLFIVIAWAAIIVLFMANAQGNHETQRVLDMLRNR